MDVRGFGMQYIYGYIGSGYLQKLHRLLIETSFRVQPNPTTRAATQGGFLLLLPIS
jgi:hypothetical protein